MCPNIRNTQVAKSVGEYSFRAVTEKLKKMKNEIQIGLEIQNSNLSALAYTAAMVYTVVYTVVHTAAAMVYTVVNVIGVLNVLVHCPPNVPASVTPI